MRRGLLAVCVVAAALAGRMSARAQGEQGPSDEGGAITFDFKDPKGVNGIGFFMNAELEPIVGIGPIAGGEIIYDPAHPESFSGEIALDAAKMRVVNDTMTEHMRSPDWLKSGEHPRITFTFTEVSAVEGVEGTDATLTVSGRLAVAGVSIPKTVRLTASYLKDRAKDRGMAESGDLLVLRSSFKVSREDFGIKPEVPAEKVGHEIGIVVGIVGYSKVK